MKMVELKFKRASQNARLPEKAHESDAGMDVFASEDVVLPPFAPTLVKTGLIPEIPEGYEIQVRPRSGLALKRGITVWNSPGTIDAGYRGEIGVILMWIPKVWNPSDDRKSEERICCGDRVAQFVIAPVTQCSVVEVSEVGESDRSIAGHGGFGSTGK